MSRFKKILKWSIVSILTLALALFTFGYWFMSLIPKIDADQHPSKAVAASIPYISENIIPNRGRILAVVTSTDIMGASGKKTGYELTELSRPYYVFTANGFEVDIASPQGGKPPVIIDDEDMGIYDYAFLNDEDAQTKVSNTLSLSEVDPNLYQAVYFVGGKGAMYDFPDNPDIQRIVKDHHKSSKVIGAVCHGPAALVNETLNDGSKLLQGKSVSSFTNREELFLIPDAEAIFPFLLEDELVNSGANFIEGEMYLQNVAHDGNLVTGQNPWSTWKLVETMITQMGYTPKERVITGEENAIHVISNFHEKGYSSTKTMISEMVDSQMKMNRTLIGMHSIVAAMQWKIGTSFQLVSLLHYAKKKQSS
ncbi:MAG: type 1 glutamine amidotransferase domain-containing protein [Ekhidna sp.]|nr:type 1 glutamine amidotransferase domain-containing protein [Ekhidna sp.]